METIFYVYFLRRPDKEDPFEPSQGQPFYVGKGVNDRHLSHRKEADSLRHKPGRKPYKIGIILFLWKRGLDFEEDIIIDNLTEQEAFEIEVEAITAYGRMDNGTGILANLTEGGEGSSGKLLSEESKRRCARCGKDHRNYGKHLSEDTKRKIGIANKIALKGRIMPLEIREKISNTLKGKKKPERSKKHCENLSKSHKGKPWSEARRKAFEEKGR